jgi:hypothetical protein
MWVLQGACHVCYNCSRQQKQAHHGASGSVQQWEHPEWRCPKARDFTSDYTLGLRILAFLRRQAFQTRICGASAIVLSVEALTKA